MFTVELGKGKCGYDRIILHTSSETRARFIYNCHNVHSGYKKRLRQNGVTVERMLTYRDGSYRLLGD